MCRVRKLQEFLQVLIPSVTKDEIETFVTYINRLMAELRILRDSVTEKDGDAAKVFLLESLGRLQEPLKERYLDFQEIGKYIERLTLLAAALPHDGERRDVQLKACELLGTLFGLVEAKQSHELSEGQVQGDSIQKFKTYMNDFDKYNKDIDMLAVGVLKTLQNKTMELPLTAEHFGQMCAKLMEDSSKSFHTWTTQKARTETNLTSLKTKIINQTS